VTLSARAIGIYTYMLHEGKVLPARMLMDTFDEGRNAIQMAINELRDAKLIQTKRTKLSQGYVTQVGFLEPKDWDPEIGTLSLLLKLYSYYTNKANMLLETKLLTNPRETREEKNILHIGGKNVVYEPSADDKEYEAEKARLQLEATHERKKLAREQKQASHELKVFNRNEKETKDWTATDSSIEFAYQLHKRWDVAPFSVGESRLAFAMHDARATHDTNGVIEQKMIQMFLSEPYVQTMKDPNAIWKLFISKFSALAEQARYAIVDPEKQERAKKASDAAKRRLRED
jgi:hypothetical protein